MLKRFVIGSSIFINVKNIGSNRGNEVLIILLEAELEVDTKYVPIANKAKGQLHHFSTIVA